MNSLNNSVRLNRSRLNFSGRRTSISEYEPKQTFKLAAIRSITKGVKYNDISLITGSGNNKLRPEHAEHEDTEYVATHENLTTIRKRYDEVKRQRVAREIETQKLKEELNHAKASQSQYLQKKSNAQIIHDKLHQELRNKKLLFEESNMDTKCRLHIIHRIKQDKVVYDHRTYQLHKQLNNLKKQIQILHKEGNQAGQSSDRAKRVYDKLLAQIQKEEQERQEHIKNLKDSIKKREQLNKSAVSRENQMVEIAQRAMQDKDHNQKNWRNLLRVNQFISVMLRDKMEKEMKKFSIVETAYKNIKIATGVTDTQIMVNKFLNKQSQYGLLLSKIAESEKRIELLKIQNQTLMKENKELQQEQALFQIGKRNTVELQNEFKLLDAVDSKSSKHHLHMQKFISWLGRQARKLGKLQKVQKINFSSDKLEQSVASFCVSILKTLQDIQKNDKAENFDVILNTSQLSRKQLDKIQRIKFQKQKKTEEDPNEIDQEQKLPTSYNEQQYILNNRIDLLRENEKFMKQLKKKNEALIKTRIEQSPPKKKQSEKNITKLQQEQSQ